MRAMVVEEYGTAPALSEVADPPGPAADVLAASLNPGPAIRKNGVSILAYAIFTVPARERSGAFARLAGHAAAGGTDRRIPRNRTGSPPGHLGRLRGRPGGHQDHRQAE